MVPTVFATGFAMFEGKKAAMIPAILGVVSTLAPTLGPSVGGLITEIAGWRWLFFINVVPGLAITVLVPILGKVDDPHPSMLRKIDWAHLLGLAVFLGGLQYALEEGPRHEWLHDPAVATAAWLSFVGGLLFFERCFYSQFPLVKLSAFRRPTFALACALNVITGVGLYGATYLMPLFLGRVRGFSSLDIGETVFVTGLAMAFGAPLAARLSGLVDQRYVMAAGFVIFAAGLWLTSAITPEWGFMQLLIPQMVRGFAILLCIVPSVGMALNSLVGEELRYGSGLFNLMRNLGGAFGIALANTWLTDFSRLHAARLGEGMGLDKAPGSRLIDGLANLMPTTDGARAALMAQAELARMISRQALTLAFADVFRVMAFLFLAGLLLLPLVKPTNLKDRPAPSGH
jgi:DHA2 family multidrug resistance protein